MLNKSEVETLLHIIESYVEDNGGYLSEFIEEKEEVNYIYQKLITLHNELEQ